MDPQAQQQPPAPQVTPQRAKSKKKLIIILAVVTVVVVAAIIAVVLLLVRERPLDSRQTAEEFVDALVRKDYDRGYSLLNEGPNSMKDILTPENFEERIAPAPFSPESCKYTIDEQRTEKTSSGTSVDVVEGTLACEETFSIYLEIITEGKSAGVRGYKIDPVNADS